MPVHNLRDAAIEISTHQGDRAYQQDRATYRQDYPLISACVADGMGSGQNSDRIAHLASAFATQVASVYGANNLTSAVTCAAECVRTTTDAERHPNDDTTLVLATVTMRGSVAVAWVGDSRAYVLTSRGRLYRLTKDHNYGPAAPNLLKRSLLGGEVNHVHDLDGITTCERHMPEFAEYGGNIDPAVMVVLMTDGVCGVLSDDQIRHILSTAPNARRAARRLTGVAVRTAEAKGEKPDNATALVIDLQPRTEA